MPYIESHDDVDWYREQFSDVWRSAVLTFSCIDVDGTSIPNGELSISVTPTQERTDVLYSEGPLTIYRVVSRDPFELLDDVLHGTIPTDGEPIDIASTLQERDLSGYFQTGLSEGLVRESRPQTEVNAAINIDLSDDTQEAYLAVVNELEDQLKRAKEPFYDVGRCEGYYFDYIFRSDREQPKILLFAASGIEFTINDSGVLEVTAPEPLFTELSVSILPQRPHDEHKGWRITFEQAELGLLTDGKARYREELGLDNITKLYAVLYLGTRRLTMIEHHAGDVIPENPRYEFMQAFDQATHLEGYLEGHDADLFEIAVLNTLSTAGWHVQWYGDDGFVIPSYSDDVPGAPPQEIDVIAYHPQSTAILCIECTNTGISDKEQILDRTEAISSVIDDYLITTEMGTLEQLRTVPCIATPQSPEELSGEVTSELEEKGIEILHSKRLKAIYTASRDTVETIDADIQFFETE